VSEAGKSLEERGVVVRVQACSQLARRKLPEEVHRDPGRLFLLSGRREEGEEEVPFGRRPAKGTVNCGNL
jgi:hypothetical protein